MREVPSEDDRPPSGCGSVFVRLPNRGDFRSGLAVRFRRNDIAPSANDDWVRSDAGALFGRHVQVELAWLEHLREGATVDDNATPWRNRELRSAARDEHPSVNIFESHRDNLGPRHLKRRGDRRSVVAPAQGGSGSLRARGSPKGAAGGLGDPGEALRQGAQVKVIVDLASWSDFRWNNIAPRSTDAYVASHAVKARAWVTLFARRHG